MEFHKAFRSLGILLLLGAVTLKAAEAPRIYRYVDNNGQVVFNSFIPADSVKNGYTILNQKGRVLEEVPRALSQDELAAQTAEQEQQRLAQETFIARKEADNILLRVYRTPADLERKRDLNLGEIDGQIEKQTVALAQLDINLAALTIAPEGNDLAKQQADRARLGSELQKLTAEKDRLIAAYSDDIERLKYLQGSAKNATAQ